MNRTLQRAFLYCVGLSLLCGCATVRESLTDRTLPCPFAANDVQQGRGITSSARNADVFIYPFHSDDFIDQSFRKGLYVVRLRKPLEEVSRIQASCNGFRLFLINDHHSKTMEQAIDQPFGASIYAEVLPGRHNLSFLPLDKLAFARQKTKDIFVVDFIAQPGAWYKFEKELIDRKTVRISESERLVQDKFRIYCVSLINGRQDRELLKFRKVAENLYHASYPVDQDAGATE
jgi:hypothetical protein